MLINFLGMLLFHTLFLHLESVIVVGMGVCVSLIIHLFVSIIAANDVYLL